MLPIERLQAQLHAGAQRAHRCVTVAPFTCYFSPDDPAPHANYAMPDQPLGGDLHAPLDDLVAIFKQHDRTPRFEYLEAFAPALGPLLLDHGFRLADRTLLMVCTPAQLHPSPPLPPNTAIQLLTADGPLAEMQAFVDVQGRAFEGDGRPSTTEAQADQFRRRFAGVRWFLARIDRVPVSAGSLTIPHEGVAEVAGIATLPAYRRRGMAAAVTAHIAQFAFDNGLDALFLTAADEAAGRVYASVGFAPQGSGLAFLWDETA